jgi:hypothetical protein
MKPTVAIIALACAALATPALAASYPVSGKWGQSTSAKKGPIDCKNMRVIQFNGNQRTDSKGGVPAYRNKTVTPDGGSSYRVTDEFATGQITARTTYTLRIVDADRIEMGQQGGSAVTLHRCK